MIKNSLGKSGNGNIGDINFAGSSLRQGTGGYTNSVRTSISPGANYQEMAFVTLNKGLHIVSGYTRAGSNVGSRYLMQLHLGGTPITTDLITYTPGSNNQVTISFSYPVMITSDNIKVSIFSYIETGTGGSASHEINVIKVRDL